MEVKTFLEKFGLFSNTPDAVAGLRKLILLTAVKGKLIPQDPNDEPSRTLVTRVAASLPDRKSENPFLRNIESLVTDESQYELPFGWVWLPLGHLGIWATGSGFPKKYQGETDKEFLFCKVSDMNLPGNGVEIHTTVHSIDATVMKKIRARPNPLGTVIFPKIGGAIATHKRRLLIQPTIIDNNCSGIQPIGLTDDRWMLLLLQNLDLTRYQSGTSVPAVSQSALNPIRIGLPPLAEQKRIVAKVDELMALCDQLEAQQQERKTQHAALARASLARFADAPTPANLEFLFHPSYSISPADLRKAVLTLAVQGKLVTNRNTNDGLGFKLLQNLKVKKALQVRSEQIRKRKPVSALNRSTWPWELPTSWAFPCFDDVLVIVSGVTKGRKLAGRETIVLPYLRVANVQRGHLDLGLVKQIEVPIEDRDRYRLKSGDVLMTEGGDWDKLGRAAIWAEEIPDCIHQNHVYRVRSPDKKKLLPEWIALFANSPPGRSFFEAASKQTTNLASINMTQLRSCPLPLPGAAEQRRIVAKVDQLMTLVDELGAQLTKSQTTAKKLLAAVVAELTAAPA